MIEYIKGEIAALTPASVTVETKGGVAYLMNITLPTFTQLEGKTAAKLFIHETMREDVWSLYGFVEEEERRLFRSLIGVPGVGASTAIIILSSLQGSELAAVISAADVKRLKSIKGIGAKTAERIIVDLRDKIKTENPTLPFAISNKKPDAYEEAQAALIMLGFDKKNTEKALDKLFGADPDLRVETAIKKALSMM